MFQCGLAGLSSHTWSAKGKAEHVWQSNATQASQHPLGLIIAACVIRDIVLTSQWDGSRSETHAGFLERVIWFCAGTAEPGWVVISSLRRDRVGKTRSLATVTVTAPWWLTQVWQWVTKQEGQS